MEVLSTLHHTSSLTKFHFNFSIKANVNKIVPNYFFGNAWFGSLVTDRNKNAGKHTDAVIISMNAKLCAIVTI